MNSLKYKLCVLTAGCLAAIMPTTLFAADPPQTAPAETAELIAVLTSDAAVFDKAKACQRLAVIGDKRAVPALAGLLTDEKLSNYARHGLEGIPDPEAKRALRAAIARLDGNLLVGVVNSVAKRRDTEAVGDLRGLLAHENDAVAAAAARALGHVGNAQTAEILGDALTKAAAERRPALAQACLVCAQRLLQQNDRQRAADLSDLLRKSPLPKHLLLAATNSAILARGKDGVPLLVEQFDSDDEARFRLGLQTARLLGADVSPQLIAQFDKQPPERQALLLLALGDLGDAAAVPTIVTAARTGPPEVRVQAIRVLARLGNATAVPTLLDAALHENERIAKAARSSLAGLPGDQVNAAIVEMLASNDAEKRRVAADLAAQRKIVAATPGLLKMADGPVAAQRIVALKALGSTIQLEDLPKLLAKTAVGYTPEELAAAREATRAACVRMPREKCAALLASRLSDASADVRAFLLETLGVIGGPLALNAVVTAARDGNDTTQDAATRVLGEWLTADAAPAMHELANSLTSDKYKIRVLRGYVRLARQLDMPLEQRLEVCRNTLKIAKRRDEKALVLEVLRRHAAPGGLAIATSLLDQADLKEQACDTIVAISEKVVRTSPAEAEKALQQVLQTTNRKGLRKRAEELIAEAQKASATQ